MKKKIDDLSIRAINGDFDAVNVLFDIAIDCEKNEQYENASIAYRKMVSACRVLASKSRVEEEEVEIELESMTVATTVYAWWAKEHPDGMKKLPYHAAGIDPEFIRKAVRGEGVNRLNNYVCCYVENVLEDVGMRFGGGFARRVCALLGFVFGLKEDDSRYTKFLQYTAVRIGLDLLADEIVRRYATNEQSVSDA